ncbi:MAG: hypothetical protein ACKPKO_42565, partial [Candidatus Fonsibacter sp.]
RRIAQGVSELCVCIVFAHECKLGTHDYTVVLLRSLLFEVRAVRHVVASITVTDWTATEHRLPVGKQSRV